MDSRDVECNRFVTKLRGSERYVKRPANDNERILTVQVSTNTAHILHFTLTFRITITKSIQNI